MRPVSREAPRKVRKAAKPKVFAPLWQAESVPELGLRRLAVCRDQAR